MATRPIRKGHLIGFSYGLEYFYHQKRPIQYFSATEPGKVVQESGIARRLISTLPRNINVEKLYKEHRMLPPFPGQ